MPVTLEQFVTLGFPHDREGYVGNVFVEDCTVWVQKYYNPEAATLRVLL